MKSFEFNKVYIIESVNERETGRELYEDLIHRKTDIIKELEAELLQISSKEDFFIQLQYIKNECSNRNIFPIIHFEIHGSEEQNGFVLKSKELVEWIELYESLVEINSCIGNNLFITLAVCHGAYIMELIDVNKPSPFWGFLGSFDVIKENDLVEQYNDFYTDFLENYDINRAIKSMENLNPDISSSYRFISSEDAFRRAYKRYFQEYFDESKILDRFNIALNGKYNDLILNATTEAELLHIFRKNIFDSEKQRKFFEQKKEVFFMIDKFTANRNRFNINFDDVNT